MQSRMDKYYDELTEDNLTKEYVPTNTMSSRTKRNEELYKEVSSLEIENFDVNSNVSVLGKSKKSIDLDEIRDIIDRKYHEEPKNRSIGVDDTQELPEINLSETREYDINSIIEKAKSTKEVNYEEDRLKKLKNTQYDILKNLNLDLKEEKDDKKHSSKIENTDTLDDILSDTMSDTEKLDEVKEEYTETLELDDMTQEHDKKAMVSETKNHELLDLINTITTKELIQETQELDPLDILSDLRGDNDNTKVMGAIFSDMLEEELKEEKDNKKTKIISSEKTENKKVEDKVNIDKSDKKEESTVKVNKDDDEENSETKIIKQLKATDEKNSPTIRISKKEIESEYDDFKDLQEDMKVSRIIVKVLLVMIVIVFIVGCIILLNKVFDWGLIQ